MAIHAVEDGEELHHPLLHSLEKYRRLAAEMANPSNAAVLNLMASRKAGPKLVVTSLGERVAREVGEGAVAGGPLLGPTPFELAHLWPAQQGHSAAT